MYVAHIFLWHKCKMNFNIKEEIKYVSLAYDYLQEIQ